MLRSGKTKPTEILAFTNLDDEYLALSIGIIECLGIVKNGPTHPKFRIEASGLIGVRMLKFQFHPAPCVELGLELRKVELGRNRNSQLGTIELERELDKLPSLKLNDV